MEIGLNDWNIAITCFSMTIMLIRINFEVNTEQVQLSQKILFEIMTVDWKKIRCDYIYVTEQIIAIIKMHMVGS